MSSSDSDSDISQVPHGSQSLQQVSHHIQDDARIRRHVPTSTPQVSSEGQRWLSSENVGQNSTLSSSTSASRAGPSGHVESTRYGVTPLSMSNMSNEARRQSIMAMDRKRRLTGSTHDSSARRRSAAPGFDHREDYIRSRSSETHPSSSHSSAVLQRHRVGSSPNVDVIDLTNSPPPQTTANPNLTRRSSGSTSAIYVVPRWQLDSEVSECPICRRPFTFLFRRHHCRKCGRVVCNECSPHRITIPRQFIVNPPGPSDNFSLTGRETVDLTGNEDDDGDDLFARTPLFARPQYQHLHSTHISGGEKVRLCNPCVPDPQPDPQPNYSSNTLPTPSISNRREDFLTLSDALRSSRHDFHNHNVEPFPGMVHQHLQPFAPQSSRSRPLPLPPHSRNGTDFDPSQLFHQPANNRYRTREPMSFDHTQTIHHRHHNSESSRMPMAPTTRPRVRSMLDDSYIPRIFPGHMPHPRPRVNEEDICPICRRMLPPKGPGGDETARETHIMDCINARDPSQMGTSRGSGTQPSPPRGPMHMLPFIATEKDCVSEDGNVPECSICMVEYDVGDELARLECLCKFHRECISEWFTRKQECPVHKIS